MKPVRKTFGRGNKRGREPSKPSVPNADVPLKLQKLAKHCLQKWNCVLHLMPSSFSRRRENRTFMRSGAVAWTVEVFAAGKRIALLHRVLESDTIESVIAKCPESHIPNPVVVMPVYGRPANSPKYFKVALLEFWVL